MSDPDEAKRKAEEKRKAQWRVARLSVAGAVLLGYAVAAIFFFRECSVVATTEAAADKLGVVTTCAPPTLTSATVLLLLLALVLLLWPDISEVTVLGVTLKQRVAEAKQEAQVAQDKAEALRLQLTSVQADVRNAVTVATQAQVAAASSATAKVDIHQYQWGPAGAVQLREGAQRLEAGGAELRLIDGAVAEPEWLHDPDWLTGRIVRDWDRLQGRLNLGPGLTVQPDLATPTAEAQTILRGEFVGEHADVLPTLVGLRNAVVGGAPVPVQDLEVGAQVLTGLLRQYDASAASL